MSESGHLGKNDDNGEIRDRNVFSRTPISTRGPPRAKLRLPTYIILADYTFKPVISKFSILHKASHSPIWNYFYFACLLRFGRIFSALCTKKSDAPKRTTSKYFEFQSKNPDFLPFPVDFSGFRLDEVDRHTESFRLVGLSSLYCHSFLRYNLVFEKNAWTFRYIEITVEMRFCDF